MKKRLSHIVLRFKRGQLKILFISFMLMHQQIKMLLVLMDKAATEELLSERGYPTPPNALITKSNIDDAVRFFEAQDRCVVVKPASGTAGGRGVTTHITKVETLRDALRKAARYADTILVEKHIIGGSYRLLYVGGHYIDAVRRDPATVTGDGRSSIKQLIKKENQRRLRGKPISALLAIRINQDCTSTLSRQGLTTSSVPAAGEEVQIKTAINDNSAAQNHNVRDDVHPDVIAMGERIMADLGIPLGGIDIQTSDITRPLSQTGGAVIEINSPPGIHHHYLLADRQKVTPVAEHILEHIFTTGEGALRGQTRPARTENSGAAPKHAGSDRDEQKTIKVNANAS